MTSDQALGLAVLVGLAWWWWQQHRPLTATVTTSESFDLPPTEGGPVNYPDKIYAFAQAIAVAEGFYTPGSVPNRANNPGDLKLPGTTAIDNGITVFPSAEAGWNALYHQLYLITQGGSSVYSLDMSIADMAQYWTATQQTAWASNVANGVGVDVSTPLWQVLV